MTPILTACLTYRMYLFIITYIDMWRSPGWVDGVKISCLQHLTKTEPPSSFELSEWWASCPPHRPPQEARSSQLSTDDHGGLATLLFSFSECPLLPLCKSSGKFWGVCTWTIELTVNGCSKTHFRMSSVGQHPQCHWTLRTVCSHGW